MANYTQYIPQTGSTTYTVSINDCFTALTTDVTALENDKLDLAGGTMTGTLSLSGDPKFALNASTKQYTDDNFLAITGGTLTGALLIGADTVVVQDAALTDGNIVSGDASGRITTATGITTADLATLSGVQTLSGNKTFSGTNLISGVNTFSAIPVFNGGTSGVSAPFTVDSTFIVTNLNADQLDGQEGTYYAPLASPTFTGTPVLPTGTTGVTQTAADNSTKLSTTAYADASSAAAVAAISFRGALVEQTTTAQNISSVTETAVTFGTGTASEVYDTDSIHDLATNNTRLTVPSNTSYVKVSGQIEYDVDIADNTMVILKIHKNGSAFSGIPEIHIRSISYGSDTKYPSLQITSPVIPAVPTDYFELIVEHKDAGTAFLRGSGGQVWFAMEIIE